MPEQYVCEKCNRRLNDVQFYTYKDGNKMEICKNCLTMHVDNFNPETYLWILQKVDVPYIESEWNNIREKALVKDPTGSKMNGTTVLGKYLSKMKLKQWNRYTWTDTEQLAIEDEKNRTRKAEEQVAYEAMMREKLEEGEITETQYKTLVGIPEPSKAPAGSVAATAALNSNNPFQESYFMNPEDMPDLTKDLTQDDKKALALKWRPPLYSIRVD